MKFNINLALIFSIAMAFGTTWAEEKKEQSKDYRAHSHGNGNLELVIDGNTVRGKFEIPMDILLGFENLPKIIKNLLC